MKILVIEDNDMKYENIVEYFNALGEKDITRKTSRNGGLCELLNNNMSIGEKYSIVIIDMMLPFYEDTRELNMCAGLEILREIDRKKYDIEAVLFTGEDVVITTEEHDALNGEKEQREFFTFKEHEARIKPNMRYIKYNSSVYQKDDFAAVLDAANQRQNERELDKYVTTYVVAYQSFDAPELKICETRRKALDYMYEDAQEEIKIQTENGKQLGVDMFLTGDAYKEEYLKLTYANGDFIAWSIPEVLD